MRILLVDDHVLFREGLVSILKNQPDFDIVGEAGLVSEAISQARETKPDVILMDFSLPDGTGADATQAILVENPDIKIVFLTIHENDDCLLAAIRRGAKGYLLKNLSVNNLLSSLRALGQGEPAISGKMVSKLFESLSKEQSSPKTILPGPKVNLTCREVDVLREMDQNSSNSEIASKLFIAENTVKNHVHNILSKLKVSSRRQAVDYAHRIGLL